MGSLKALELLNSLVPSTNSGRRQDKADSAAAATTADEATDQSARSTDVWPLLTQYLEVCESLLLKNGLEGERASAENLERTIALIDRPLLEKLQSKYYAGLGERVRFFADVRLMFVYGALGEMDRAMEHLGRVSGGGDAGAMATDKDQLSQKQSSSTPYLVYRRLIQVGRLRKNHDLVIKSWEQLRATHKRRDDFAFSGLAFDAAEAYAAVGRADEMIKVLEAEEGAQAKQRMLKPGFYERAVAVVEAACANADENAAHVPALQAVLDKYRAELAALKGAADKRESKASSKPTAGRQNSYGVTVAIMEAFDAGDSERTVAAIRDHFASGRRLPYTVSNQIATFFESKQCAEGLELLVSDVNPDPSAGALRLGLMHYVEEKKVPEAWALFGKVQPLLEKEKRFPGMPFFSKLVQLFSTTGNQAWV